MITIMSPAMNSRADFASGKNGLPSFLYMIHSLPAYRVITYTTDVLFSQTIDEGLIRRVVLVVSY